eukprot:jgi/Astpho2/292/fgenesh1_pg.00010_%23_53_t
MSRSSMECAVDIRDSSNHDPQEEETFLRLARTTSAAAKASASHENGRQTTAAMNFSWAANILLLAAKIAAFIFSLSFAVLASAADSLVDLASQAVLQVAEWTMAKQDAAFPIGKTRLECIGVILCAVIMSIATFQVITESLQALYAGILHNDPPEVDAGLWMLLILGVATVVKLFLYFCCQALSAKSSIMLALAEDHRNDVMSNIVAIIGAAVAANFKRLWWFDPALAITISIYIIYSWAKISKGQVDKILGKGAPPEFIEEVRELSLRHHCDLEVDVIRGFHFGSRFLVEIEIILPAQMTVQESHDIALLLQHKVEALPDVERAHVHVDYLKRGEPEHKVERNLASGVKDVFKPHSLLDEQALERGACLIADRWKLDRLWLARRPQDPPEAQQTARVAPAACTAASGNQAWRLDA